MDDAPIDTHKYRRLNEHAMAFGLMGAVVYIDTDHLHIPCKFMKIMHML